MNKNTSDKIQIVNIESYEYALNNGKQTVIRDIINASNMIDAYKSVNDIVQYLNKLDNTEIWTIETITNLRLEF